MRLEPDHVVEAPCGGYVGAVDDALPDKARVHRALRDALAATHAAMVASAREAAAGATHEDARAEGDKDMRATEASYVARGQAMRAEALAEDLARVEAMRVAALGADDPVQGGALVQVAIDGGARWLYVCAWGGGTVLDVDGLAVTVVGPGTPMGRALVGRHEGDDFSVRLRGAVRAGEILVVR